MIRPVTKLLGALLFFSIVFAIQTAPVDAQAGNYTCWAFSCYNTSTQAYRYHSSACTVSCPLGVCSGSFISCFNLEDPSCTIESPNHINTNWSPNGSAGYCNVAGCGQGLNGANTPTCSGGEGGGGGGGGGCGCPAECSSGDPACQALGSGPACPGTYSGSACSNIPCAHRNNCGCGTCLDGCDPQCTPGCSSCGGGGGSPTPTPTPAPSCELSCPGRLISDLSGGNVSVDNSGIGGLGGATVKGATTLLTQSGVNDGGSSTPSSTHYCGVLSGTAKSFDSNTTYAFGRLEGQVEYNGSAGHECDTFLGCPLDPALICPEPTITSGGNDVNIVLAPALLADGKNTSEKNTLSKVLGAASDDSRLSNNPIGKVLGALSNILPTQNRLISQSSVGGGNTGVGGTASSYWAYGVELDRLEGSSETVYGYTVSDAQGRSCSCEVVLGCFETQQADPNSAESIVNGCDFQCDFSFDAGSEYPEALEEVFVTISANDGFDSNVVIDWDNGIVNDITGLSSTSQTLLDSGTYDVKLTCQNPGGGITKTCTRRLSTYCTGTSPETLPTPTPTPPGAWLKLKDSSTHVKTTFANPAPSDAVPYDSDDAGICDTNAPSSPACVSSGQAGVVTARGDVNYGTRLSDREWLRSDSSYNLNNLLTPSGFIEYARARRDVLDIDSVASDTVQAGIINIYDDGSVTLSDNSVPDALGGATVIVIDGDLNIDMSGEVDTTFNRDNKPMAFIVTGSLNISEDTTEINGVFVSNTINFAYDAYPRTTTPLKINGNVTSMSTSTSCASKRQRDDNELQPSCFFTFDFANQFLPLTGLLTTRTYEWTELVP